MILSEFYQRIGDQVMGFRNGRRVLEFLAERQRLIKIDERIAVLALIRVARSDVIYTQRLIRLVADFLLDPQRGLEHAERLVILAPGLIVVREVDQCIALPCLVA